MRADDARQCGLTDRLPDPAWRPVVAAFPHRCWDGDYVVYNPLSGNTHVLDIVTGHALMAIVADHLRETELRQRIAAFLEVPDDAALAEHVAEILGTLDRLGLIEPVAGC